MMKIVLLLLCLCSAYALGYYIPPPPHHPYLTCNTHLPYTHTPSPLDTPPYNTPLPSPRLDTCGGYAYDHVKKICCSGRTFNRVANAACCLPAYPAAPPQGPNTTPHDGPGHPTPSPLPQVYDSKSQVCNNIVVVVIAVARWM